MEAIWALYAAPYDPRYSVVRFDEEMYQLVSEVCRPVWYDDAYRRDGPLQRVPVRSASGRPVACGGHRMTHGHCLYPGPESAGQ
jgi:hypothetical protein